MVGAITAPAECRGAYACALLISPWRAAAHLHIWANCAITSSGTIRLSGFNCAFAGAGPANFERDRK
jgi:hypothetical protein